MTNFEPLSRGQSHLPDVNTAFSSIFNLRVTRSLIKSPFLGEHLTLQPCIDSNSPHQISKSPSLFNTPVRNPVYIIPLPTSLNVSPSIFQFSNAKASFSVGALFSISYKVLKAKISLTYTWIPHSKTHM